MAIGTPVERFANQNTLSGATSRVIQPASTMAASTTGFIFVHCSGSNTAGIVTSVTDDVGGNSYSVVHTTGAQNQALSVIFYSLVNQVATTAHITINLTAAVSNVCSVWIEEVSGLAASPFDKSHDNNAASTTAFSTGSSGVLSQPVEILWGFGGTNNNQSTGLTGTGWSNPTTAFLLDAVLQYLIVSATTAQTCAGTLQSSANYNATVVTFKGSAAPPVNTVAPAVTGTATVGQTLSCSTGTWTDDGSPTFTYQWQRDVHGSGAYGNIATATSSTYVLTDAEDACHIRCVVTCTDTGGSVAANSNAVGTVVEPVPANTVAPVVSGTAPQGSNLTVTQGTWNNMGGYLPSFAYQWTRDGSNIAAATASNYVTVAADVGHAVGCTVTATNTGGSTAQASSNTITVTAATGGGTVPAEGEWGLEWQP